MYELELYQERGVQETGQKFVAGIKNLVFQLATGGGKTVVFSAISHRYIQDPGRGSVLILVHRKELLIQTRKTLYKGFGVISQPIIAGMRHVPDARVYVGMVETVNRRIAKLRNITLVIIDECHYANFNKLHKHFPQARIIGFTATPLAASKKNPLKDYYQDIVCGIDIPDLIQLNKVKPERGLVQNITRAPKDIVDRSELKADRMGDDYDTGLMALSFSKPKHIENTVVAYERYAPNTKAIVFCVNRDHGKLVSDAFIAKGYPCKYLDGETDEIEGKGTRAAILKWYTETPNAILCNVDILTAGFDEPTIETVIVNRSTMSLAKWLQMCGRGSRPTLTKSMFTIIDMGGNALVHGDWCDARDWREIFFNPPRPGEKKGIAPVKDCPQCDAIIPAQSKTCPYCGYCFPAKAEAKESPLQEFVVITKGIDVKAVIENNRNRREYAIFYGIGTMLAENAKNFIPEMTDENAEFILQQYHVKADEWCIQVGKQYNDWHRQRAKSHLFDCLKQNYPQWKPNNN
jgi:superfamily II DNA or RNA helicase